MLCFLLASFLSRVILWLFKSKLSTNFGGVINFTYNIEYVLQNIQKFIIFTKNAELFENLL